MPRPCALPLRGRPPGLGQELLGGKAASRQRGGGTSPGLALEKGLPGDSRPSRPFHLKVSGRGFDWAGCSDRL